MSSDFVTDKDLSILDSTVADRLDSGRETHSRLVSSDYYLA